MIDPRLVAAGAVPFAPGYGPQQVPYQQQQQHHHHHHHHHRRSKHNGAGDSPLSRDESIHKVDHGHHHTQASEGVPFTGGYGVPYSAGGFGGVGAPGGYYSQQPPSQFPGGNYGFNSQFQGGAYEQGQFASGPGAPAGQHRRRHHRHHRHQAEETVTGSGVADQAQGVPEQLIGQRSSSVLGNEAPQVGSPAAAPTGEGEGEGGQANSRRHRHRRHHHHHHHQAQQQQQQPTSSAQAQQGHASTGADGYGHINDELIFIERGEHSPHRQEPPPGYDYKGKIEVQNIDKEHRSQSRAQSGILPTVPAAGPCPPGWQQMVVTAAPGGPCPPGAAVYTGQLGVGVGAAAGASASAGVGVPQPAIGGLTSFGSAAGGIGFAGAGPIGAAGSGAGLASLAASLPFPPQGQLIADYIVESNAGGVASAGGSGFLTDYQQSAGGSFTNHTQTSQVHESVSSRPTIIEVWQKRSKSDGREQSPSHSRSPKRKSSFDFERFRAEILGDIERAVQNSNSGVKVQWTGHDGGTQTQIHPSTVVERKEVERKVPGGSGEVRVIVQPIQPVFYMPRQGETAGAAPIIAGGPAIQQASGGANVVYVPRNVYVPVIKPVFVPRERVIVRPQVIHVARPVLVDRPVPVTQRPIIIDRERPVPVPTRGGVSQGVTHTSSASNLQQDFGYQDNSPVSYTDQAAGFSNNVNNYDYAPAPQEQQYESASTHEFANDFQAQGPAFDVPATEQFEHSQSASHLAAQQSGGSFHESYSNLARTSSAAAVNVTPLACAAPIDVLDATINPNWQRTDKTTLVQRYGRPAYDIVQRTDQVEQQMYQELRQRTSSGGIQRSSSAASYGSGSGIGIGGGGGAGGAGGSYGISSSSYSNLAVDDLQNFHGQGLSQRSSSPVCVNY